MKYNSKKTGGYRSKFEADLAETMPRRRGVKVRYETEEIQYSIPHVYTPDFTIYLPKGRQRHIEAKGYFRPEDKVKMKYVRICNPSLDIRMVFPKNNKKDIKWCERNGFPYAIGTIPREWLLDE